MLLLVGFVLGPFQVPAIAGQAASTTSPRTPPLAHQSYAASVIASGSGLFQQNCVFCHGRDAGGSETGLFDKYTDDDIHNLMAYMQTFR
ncbi:MAG: hypothetical protein ABI197_02565 [Granulicella sp.]